MKIVIVSSEIHPFAKTGGLADVTSALGKYLSLDKNFDVRLITPLYSITEMNVSAFFPVNFMQDLETWFGGRKIVYSVYTAKLPGSSCDVYFISCPEFYNRWSVYTNDADEFLRFAILSKVSFEICQRLGWSPDIIHCNDWQTGLIPLFGKTLYNWDTLFKDTRYLITIHNIAYQGVFGSDIIPLLDLATYSGWLDDLDLKSGVINFLKTGIIYADKISTVSKTYALEIQTPFYGEGLDPVLSYRKSNLHGIVNGVDYDDWNPQKDTHIPFPYSIKNPERKKLNKKQLFEAYNIPHNEDIPLIGLISRLVVQKGIDIMMPAMINILNNRDVRFFILGSGERRYEDYFHYLHHHYPGKVYFFQGYNNELSHLIEAASDIFLMPSLYEPCGLNQIYSLKYGTIPVVRKTGGLADTVQLYNWEDQSGTGFVFENYSKDGLEWAINSALETYKNKTAWKKLVRNAMKMDFSWHNQIKEYIQLYQWLKR